MELSSFSENIVNEPFERNGEVVNLRINIDAIVPDYYDQLEDRLAPITKRFEAMQKKYDEIAADIEKRAKSRRKPNEQAVTDLARAMRSIEKESGEIKRELYAEKLTCPVLLPDGSYTALLKDWDVTEKGKAVPPTKENLVRLPPQLVEELWKRCEARFNTVKKTVDEETIQNQTTPETMETGSQEFTLPLNAPLM